MNKKLEHRGCYVEITKIELFNMRMYTFGVRNPIGNMIKTATVMTESMAEDYAISAVNEYIDYVLHGYDNELIPLFGSIDVVTAKLEEIGENNSLAQHVIDNMTDIEKRRVLYKLLGEQNKGGNNNEK